MFLENSQDILNYSKVFAVVILSVFTAWFIYYLAMIMRQVFKVVKEMRDRIKKVDEALTAFKEKIEHSTSYLLLIGEGVKKLVEIAKDYSEKKEKK